MIADHGRLDAVVNNAGAGHSGTLENETVDDVRRVMEVNFFGQQHSGPRCTDRGPWRTANPSIRAEQPLGPPTHERPDQVQT